MPKHSFNFYPQSLKNSAIYIMLFALFLVWLSIYGDMWWLILTKYFTLMEVFVGGGFIFYMLLFWGLAAGYLYLFYKKEPEWLYKYKIQEAPEHSDGKHHRVPLSKSILVVLGNQVFGTLPFILGVYYIMVWRGYGENLEAPVWWVATLQIIGMVLFQDFFFYFSHRLMHQKFLFKHIHRIHHEYRETVATATHYVHYIEHLVGNLFPVFIGAVILLPHPFVILFWIMLIVMNALHTHSGFAIPWMSYAVHHDWHHYHVNGSFSSIGLADKLFGTDKAFEARERDYKTHLIHTAHEPPQI